LSSLRAYFGVLLVVLLAGCGGARPLVERFEEGAWEAETYQVASLTGSRDAIEVFFSLELVADGGRRLVLEGTIEVDPQARLVSSHWAEEGGSGDRSGSASAPALTFSGGQGGRPGLGGRFTLSASGAPLYRVNLPITPLAPSREPG
jgi:hypothetical protein